MVVHHEELPVKHIPLSCLQGHFVVVTSAIACQGEYFLSVGSASSHKRYRVYVLDNEGNIVYGEMVRNGEFIHCRLNQEEYEIYVSPVFDHDSREKGIEESFELVQDHQEHFNLWIQGKQVHSKKGELEL